MYIQIRNKVWHFSRRLSSDCAVLPGTVLILADRRVTVGSNGYVRFSLKTEVKTVAQRLGRKYAAALDEALATWSVTSALPLPSHTQPQGLTDQEIVTAASLMKVSLLSADEEKHGEALASLLAGGSVERPADREQGLQQLLPPATAAGDAELLARLAGIIPLFVLQVTGKPLTGKLSDFGTRLMPFVTQWRELVASLDDRAHGKLVPTPSDPRHDPLIGARLDWAGVLSYYEEQHPYLSTRSKALYKLAITELAEYVKCVPAELKRAQVIGWRDSLLTRLSPKTVLTRVTGAGSVYRYGLDNEKLGERSNPFANVTVVGAKSAPSSRKGFSLQTLHAIFNPLPALSSLPDAVGGHAAIWIPILALFTGARRGELAGMLVDEVRSDFGVWYLELKDNELRELKNANSERCIPLHQQVIELGFLNYVMTVRAAGASKLFPGIADPNSVGEWFSKYVRERAGKSDSLQDLHSFRHTFKTACRNVSLVQEVHDAMTGHATPGVGAKYGDPAGIEKLKEEIDKVVYPGLTIPMPTCPSKAAIVSIDRAAERRLLAARGRKRKPQE